MTRQKPINELSLVLSEAEIKKAVNDFLQYKANLGQLIYLRLNAGSFILSDKDGNFRRRVQGTPTGTADYVVFQGVKHTLCYGKQPFTDCKPLPACRVTFLEIKSSKGKQSPEQRAFEILAHMFNCRYCIVRDADELEGILQ